MNIGILIATFIVSFFATRFFCKKDIRLFNEYEKVGNGSELNPLSWWSVLLIVITAALGTFILLSL